MAVMKNEQIHQVLRAFVFMAYLFMFVLSILYITDVAKSQFFTMVNGTTAEETWEWIQFFGSGLGLLTAYAPQKRKSLSMQLEACAAGLVALTQGIYVWTQITVRIYAPAGSPPNPMPWNTVLGLSALISLLLGRVWFLMVARRDLLLHSKANRMMREEGL